MPIKAVCLDVGWTLAHPQRSIWDIFAEICVEAGADVDARRCEAAIGELRSRFHAQQEESFRGGAAYSDSDEEFAGGFAQMGAVVLGAFHLTIDPAEFQRRFLEAFWTEGNWQLFPEVLEVIEALRSEGARVGVLSNAPTNLPAFLDRLGVSPLLDFAVVSAVEGFRKPDRRIFDVAIQRAGVAPGEIVHVGDMYLEDILGGRNAGVSPLLIERGERSLFPNFPESRGRAIEPTDIVRDLRDVLDRVRAANA